MAKFDIKFTLKRENGTQMGDVVNILNSTSLTAAKATVLSEVQSRIDAEAAYLSELQDVQTKLNS
jgi:hypothetical protein